MLASESHLIANRTVIAIVFSVTTVPVVTEKLALCTLGMAFLFRIVSQSTIKGSAENNGSGSSALASTDTAGTKCNKIKGPKSCF
jgi:hypothetical protein